MELRRLESSVTVAEELRFARAATRLVGAFRRGETSPPVRAVIRGMREAASAATGPGDTASGDVSGTPRAR